jgi:exodeoxyribonuclease VII small subunit
MTAKKHVEEKLGFEEALERLEKIVSLLERGDATLEDSLKHFEEGVALSRRCHELLAVAEKRVSRLVREEEGGLTLELFPTEPSDA